MIIAIFILVCVLISWIVMSLRELNRRKFVIKTITPEMISKLKECHKSNKLVKDYFESQKQHISIDTMKYYIKNKPKIVNTISSIALIGIFNLTQIQYDILYDMIKEDIGLFTSIIDDYLDITINFEENIIELINNDIKRFLVS